MELSDPVCCSAASGGKCTRQVGRTTPARARRANGLSRAGLRLSGRAVGVSSLVLVLALSGGGASRTARRARRFGFSLLGVAARPRRGCGLRGAGRRPPRLVCW